MAETFNLPDVGEGLTEAEIVTWRVAVGDAVEVNDIVVEIETAKSLVELPVPFDGVVAELVAELGETIEVGSPLIRIRTSDDADGDSDSDVGAESGEISKVEVHEESATDSKDVPESSRSAAAEEGSGSALVGSGPKADAAKRRLRTRATQIDQVDVSDLGLGPSERAASGRANSYRAAATSNSARMDKAEVLAKSSPPVRALAKRLGVEVWELIGSGDQGQITRDDVETRAREQKDQPGAGQVGIDASRLATLTGEGEWEEKVKVRGVRKATALNVSESASTVPHISVFKEVDVSATMQLRAALKKDPSFEGLAVSPMLFAAKAIIKALRRHRQINARWEQAHYSLLNYVNLGIAAATPRGLVVPVIHHAHAYTIRGLAAAMTQLTVDAREGKTPPEMMRDGTISITNIGPLGLDFGTPILPPGQAGIIALGTVRKKPWVVDGQIVVRDVMVLGGSFDHRLIDGDLAGAFLADVAAVMEQPGLLID